MKKYSAIVTDKYTGIKVIMRNCEYRTKSEFIETLRKNSYAVNPRKVKESSLFEYIMNNTDVEPWDWDLRKIPE